MSGEPPTRPAGPTGPAAMDDLRQRAVDLLCEAFADDRISVEEFERRVETAHAAGNEEELRALLTDLPGAGALTRSQQPGVTTPDAPGTGSHPLAAVDRSFSLPPMARPEEVSAHNVYVGIMGGGGRSGRWLPARHNWGVAVMGGLELDFRDAIFPPGVTEVRLLAFWGGAEIIVPPGVRVDVSGVGIMGGFDSSSSVPPTDHPQAPVLRITGVAIMGGVEVTVRYSGESGRDAKRRLKEERAELKRLQRGG